MKRRALFAAAIASALCAVTANAAYRVVSATKTDIGRLPGGRTAEAYDINNRGQIVGIATNRAGVERGFMYDTGLMFDVTATTGPNRTTATGINKDGTVVGYFMDSSFAVHAYRWDRGVLTPLAEPPTRSGVDSKAVAISDNGQIVGNVWYPDLGPGGLDVATMWTDPATSFVLDPALQADGFHSFATDVDEFGATTGYDFNFGRGWLWQPFGFWNTQMPPPATPPVDGYITGSTEAWGVHRRSGVVGITVYRVDPETFKLRAVYWDGLSSRSIDLGVFPGGTASAADDINGDGFIAGWSDLPDRIFGLRSAAFLFHKSFGMYLLPIDKGSFCKARALNDRSANGLIQVVGECDQRAIRWDVMVEWVP